MNHPIFSTLLLLIGESILVMATNDISVISSLRNELEFDDQSRLASHYILYPEGCNYYSSTTKTPYGVIAREVKGDALQELFEGRSPENCPAACVERGVQQSIVGAVLPERYYEPSQMSDESERTSALQRWVGQSCSKVESCLMNYYSKSEPLQVFWIDIDGKATKQFDLGYGDKGTKCFHSFLGHNFEVLHSGQLLANFKVEFNLVLAFGASPPSDNTGTRDFEAEIARALKTEWIRHERVKRIFSPLGFKKSRLPDDVFAALGALYYNNRQNTVLEEWSGKGVFVNWWETKVAFLQIPWSIKKVHQARLKDMVSEWTGLEVEETVMYGFRQYQEGARLLTHVDRLATHAVSLIVNVAQGNLDEPWPVEVYDHADRLHEIVMEPGDVIYYESAKNLHGRNRPLKGEGAYYVNLFTHYRPVGEGDSWWKNAHMKPRSPAVLETKGKCELNADSLSTIGEQLGAVQCDDARLGNTISPGFVQAKGAADLIDWWRRTAPGEVLADMGSSESNRLRSQPEEL